MMFVGRFDMIGTYGLGSQSIPVILDEKTTSSFTMGWADSWDMRGQFMGYIWALREHGLDISHAVVRGIAIQKTQFDVRSALVHYPDHMISRWAAQMLADVQAIVDAYRELTSFAGNPEALYPYNFADSCSAYGGCAFRSLCFAQDYQDFTSNFVHHIWNPLSPQPVEETPANVPSQS
jgi:hypothetical protein